MAADKKFGLLVEMKSDVKKFQQGMTKAQSGIKKFTANLGVMAKGMIAAFSIKMIGRFLKSITNLYNVQAKAEAKLLTALKGREDVQKRLMTQASVLQTITLFGDEETIAAQAMLASMGLEEDAIKRLIPLVQDLATAKGMDLVAAADLVAKSVGSSTNALSRYGIEITGAVGSSERLETASENLSKAFKGQSEAAAEAGTGGIQQLKNALGDVKEIMGGVVIESTNLNEAASDLAESIGEVDWKKAAEETVGFFERLWIALKKAYERATYLVPMFRKLATGIQLFKDILPKIEAPIEPVTYGTERTRIKAAPLPRIAPLPFQGVAAMTLEDAKATHEIFKEQQELLGIQAGYWQEFFNTITGGSKEAVEAVEMFIPAMEEEMNVLDGSEAAIASYNESIKETIDWASALTGIIAGIGSAFRTMAEDGKMSMKGLLSVMVDVTAAVIQMYLAQSMAGMIKAAIDDPLTTLGGPFVKLAVAAVAVGALQAMWHGLIPDFAAGAIVSGETVARVGEYPGARSNPEIIAPLNRLQDMLGAGGDEVVFVIKGDVMEGVRKNYYQRRQLMR